ncbi:prolyl oligopeptidase family serine peptidase [Rhizobacter fulvus]
MDDVLVIGWKSECRSRRRLIPRMATQHVATAPGSVDPSTGAAQQLLEETGPAVVLPSPSIAEPAIFHVLRDGRVIWWSQRSGWGHLYMVEPSSTARAITQGEWQVRALIHVDDATERIVLLAGGHAADPYLNAVYAVNFDGTGLTCLTPEPGQHEVFVGDERERSLAPNGLAFVDNVSSVDQLPRAWLRDATGTVLMELEAADADELWPVDLPLPEPFRVTALDGQATLWGVLYKPRGFDPTRRYPVVEVVYGAPQTAVVPKAWLPNRFATLAEQLAVLGWMDPGRVGIVGASGGGYAVVRAMADFPAFYKVGVSMCGNHDQADYIAMWGERYQGLYDAELYASQANTTVANRIEGKLLLIHGDMDENVHPAMTLRLADALIKADRRFEMLIVPNAGHMVILLPWVQRRVHDFFIDHLS